MAGGDSGGPLFIDVSGTALVVGDLNGGKNNLGAADLYGDTNSYAPFVNPDNAAFIIANAPDAVFDRAVPTTAGTGVAQVADNTILASIAKTGTVFDFQANTPVPEPASMALLAAGLGACVAIRRRKVG